MISKKKFVRNCKDKQKNKISFIKRIGFHINQISMKLKKSLTYLQKAFPIIQKRM